MRRQRTGEVGCRAEARRVQSMVKMKPAGSPRAATRHPAEARCRAEARRVQSMVKMKPAGSPRAATRHPAESRCQAEARRVQSMVKMKPASSQRIAPRHPAEARCRAEASRVQDAPASRGCRLGATAKVEKVRHCGPVFSAPCHFRFAAGKTVGLVARDVKQSMSVVESSRKSVRREGGACQPQGPAGRSLSRERSPGTAMRVAENRSPSPAVHPPPATHGPGPGTAVRVAERRSPIQQSSPLPPPTGQARGRR